MQACLKAGWLACYVLPSVTVMPSVPPRFPECPLKCCSCPPSAPAIPKYLPLVVTVLTGVAIKPLVGPIVIL